MVSFLKHNKITFVLLTLGLLITLFGCNPIFNEYVGEYADLYTVAVISIEESKGFIKANGTFQPVLEKIDEDDHGRVLFCYSEAYHEGNVYHLIMQKSENEKVYYYEGLNYIFEEIAEDNYIWLYGSKKPSTIIDKFNGVDEEDIEKLKISNNWGEAVDISKCVEKAIVKSKTQIKP